MAIQISGTTVIDNSRNLANIRNLRTVGGQSILGAGDIPVGGLSVQVNNFTSSQSFAVRSDTRILIIEAIGGGGSGGAGARPNSSITPYTAGGGAGGYVKYIFSSNSAFGTLTITIGAGGAARTVLNSAGETPGADGGQTSVTGTGITVIALPGLGGGASSSQFASIGGYSGSLQTFSTQTGYYGGAGGESIGLVSNNPYVLPSMFGGHAIIGSGGGGAAYTTREGTFAGPGGISYSKAVIGADGGDGASALDGNATAGNGSLGSGGGGASARTNTPTPVSATSGRGGNGFVRITQYY